MLEPFLYETYYTSRELFLRIEKIQNEINQFLFSEEKDDLSIVEWVKIIRDESMINGLAPVATGCRVGDRNKCKGACRCIEETEIKMPRYRYHDIHYCVVF